MLYQDDAFIAADGVADFVGDVEVQAADICDETLARGNTVEDRFDDEPTGNIVFAPRGEIIPSLPTGVRRERPLGQKIKTVEKTVSCPFPA